MNACNKRKKVKVLSEKALNVILGRWMLFMRGKQ